MIVYVNSFYAPAQKVARAFSKEKKSPAEPIFEILTPYIRSNFRYDDAGFFLFSVLQIFWTQIRIFGGVVAYYYNIGHVTNLHPSGARTIGVLFHLVSAEGTGIIRNPV